MNDRVYCSIDLELSGFDPAKDEILEIGFILFQLGSQGAEILEEWTQVFRPHREVRHKILGLTGISQAELAEAPEFSESRDFLQQKLAGTTLVGHGITLDMRFLEAFGVPCPESPIDTLELVQWLLPTHHSYNLENLMHFFAISHREAHRALADSKATIQLLEKLLGIFNGLDEAVQGQARTLAEGQNFPWAHLLTNSFPVYQTPEDSTVPHLPEAALAVEADTVLVASRDENISALAIAAAAGKNSVVVLPDKATVMKYWKHGLVTGLFTSTDIFDETKFKNLLSSSIESRELCLFVLKLLVWKATNWQSTCILDLNLSFSGSQFRALVTGNEAPINTEVEILACDHRTYIELAGRNLFADRMSVITDILRFETMIANSAGAKISWYGVLNTLRSVYNPEAETGSVEYREQVLELLAAADLFFGLIAMLLTQSFPGTGLVAMQDVAEQDPFLLTRLHGAKNSFIQKLETLAPSFPQVASTTERLERFLASDDNLVEWVEFGERHVVLASQTLDIIPLMTALRGKVGDISFVDEISYDPLLNYALARLGLSGFKKLQYLSSVTHQVSYTLSSEAVVLSDLAGHVTEQTAPVIIVMPTATEIKSFYDKYYEELKLVGPVFAEKYSGGTTKLFRNFGIREGSILLVTAETLLRATVKLQTRTLIITSAQYGIGTHPYIKSLKQYWLDQFPDFDGLHDAEIVHELLKRCSLTSLEQIYLYQSGEKPVATAVLELLGSSNVFKSQ